MALVGWNLGQLRRPGIIRLTSNDDAANPMQVSTSVDANNSQRLGGLSPTCSQWQSMLPSTWDPRQVNKWSNEPYWAIEPHGDGPNLASTMGCYNQTHACKETTDMEEEDQANDGIYNNFFGLPSQRFVK
ncbi:hypothetical protein Taro_043420 [Colocasia esculenta]|uniref:Uncharacterized protein n=1 Tax=Colocasia esculenta TaxID=4460 RepID=A0A843WRD3_COLES|nr:hypothetical protein [Colocasia esculenta]